MNVLSSALSNNPLAQVTIPSFVDKGTSGSETTSIRVQNAFALAIGSVEFIAISSNSGTMAIFTIGETVSSAAISSVRSPA